MLVFGIIFTIICIIIIIVLGIYSDNLDDVIATCVLTIGAILGILIILAYLTEASPDRKSLKENTLKTEIQVKYLDGQEVSRDTIYIFTPKKK